MSAAGRPLAVSPAGRPLAEGAELAPGYEVLAHLNRGRELDVYDVWSLQRDCRCVAKVLRPDLADDGAAGRRLVREGRLLRRLTHPHLVRAYELIDQGNHPIVILETLEGATLSHIIRDQRRALPAGEIAHLGLHLCSAIHYLHGHSYLHLDLKPSNVIAEYGRAKVIDLSLTRRAGRVPAGLGTRQYLSPEQARGGRVSPATDVWGIGGVLWAATTGKRPFSGLDGPFEQLERRAEPVSARRRLPRRLAAAIDGCLEPDPVSRPELAALTEELRAAV